MYGVHKKVDHLLQQVLESSFSDQNSEVRIATEKFLKSDGIGNEVDQ